MPLQEGYETVLFEALVTNDPSYAIEAQEARGQHALVNSTALPKECLHCEREQLEQMGIVFGDDVDDLFIEAQLPEGWAKIATDHSMWSKVVDDKGRERASIFYKAAFYDRSAHISLVRRFSYRVEPICGYKHHKYKLFEYCCMVYDGNAPVWKSEERVEQEPEYSAGDEKTRQAWRDWCERKDGLAALGKAWLDEHYRDWTNPLSHWDETG